MTLLPAVPGGRNKIWALMENYCKYIYAPGWKPRRADEGGARCGSIEKAA